jgi:O-succinylbenzoate synthase
LARDWLGPAVLGQEIASGQDLQKRLAIFKGNPFAKSLFDNAWWGLEARRKGKPLAEVIGGECRLVPVGADFGVMDSIEDLLAAVGKAVEDKFRRIKLKFRPGWDVDMVRAVRKQFPDATIHIDCNAGYKIADLHVFKEIDDLGLAMIEQPLRHDDLIDHATLQKAIKTPVCLDESITSLEHVRAALKLGSCKYVNVKPGRVGGLTVARQIHDLCKAAHIPCWVGGMLESATGASYCLSLASLDNFTYPGDIFPSERFYAEDLSDPPLVISRDKDGCPAIRVPEKLSKPHLDRLQKCTKQTATLQ